MKHWISPITRPRNRPKNHQWLMACLVMAGCGLLYLAVGSPSVRDFSHSQYQQMLAQALEQQGIDKTTLQQGLAHLSQTLEPEDTTGALMLAQGYRLLGEIEQSEQTLLTALETHPQNTNLLKELGRLKLAQARYAEAVAIFEQVLTLAPQDQEAADFAQTARVFGGLQN